MTNETDSEKRLITSAPKQVLYLDFDGVLHRQLTLTQSRRGDSVPLFEFAERLAGLLAPYPDLKIVLSTSWVVTHGFEASRRSLRHPDLYSRVVGATYNPLTMSLARFGERPRWRQIIDDVKRRRPERWIAVDDDVSKRLPIRYNDVFVEVPSRCGLGCAAAVDRLEMALEFWFAPRMRTKAQ